MKIINAFLIFLNVVQRLRIWFAAGFAARIFPLNQMQFKNTTFYHFHEFQP